MRFIRSVSLRCLSSIAALDSDPGTGSSVQQQRLLQQLFKQILEVFSRELHTHATLGSNNALFSSTLQRRFCVFRRGLQMADQPSSRRKSKLCIPRARRFASTTRWADVLPTSTRLDNICHILVLPYRSSNSSFKSSSWC